MFNQIRVHSLFALSLALFACLQVRAFDTPYPEPRARYFTFGNRPECEAKAEAGQCAENPSYMLLHCPFECAAAMRNENTKCGEWAEEGECHNNPYFMLFRCSEACERAVVWNPWARRLADLRTFHAVETDNLEQYARCEKKDSLLHPALEMHDRVRKFLVGTEVSGFTYDSPSELNGLVGVVEAIAYAMRIYGVFVRLHGSPREISALDSLLEAALNRDVLSRYDADKVMRSLPKWGDQLEEALEIVQDVIEAKGAQLWKKNCAANSRQTLDTPITVIAEHFPVGPPVDSCVASESGECTAESADDIDAVRTLSNGVRMPLIGLGTWKLNGGTCEEVVAHALKVGYRHFDTAQAYYNEWDIGWALSKALKAGTVHREELFLASKISDKSNAGAAGVRALVLQQLKHLQVSYLDLYMLHSPLPEDIQPETWAEMERMYDEGLIRALGVSNFGLHELTKLLQSARVKPMVLQNKFDVYHQGAQFDNQGLNFVKFCAANDILLVSYSPFSAYPFTMVPLSDPIVQYVADRNGLTTAETLLLWNIQLGLAAIPRSSRGPGLRENLLLRLTSERDGRAVISRRLSGEDFALLSTLQHLKATPVTLPSA